MFNEYNFKASHLFCFSINRGDFLFELTSRIPEFAFSHYQKGDPTISWVLILHFTAANPF